MKRELEVNTDRRIADINQSPVNIAMDVIQQIIGWGDKWSLDGDKDSYWKNYWKKVVGVIVWHKGAQQKNLILCVKYLYTVISDLSICMTANDVWKHHKIRFTYSVRIMDAF